MEETINISQLNAAAPTVPVTLDPDSNRLDLSGIINNTGIEDQVIAQPGALQNESVLQNLQVINDLRNRANVLDQRFNSAADDLSSAVGGRIFAGPGQRNALAQRRNSIDAERRDVASALEQVRGNVTSAQSLRAESNRLATAAAAAQAARDEINNTDFDSLLDRDPTVPEVPEDQRTDEEIQIQDNEAIIAAADATFGGGAGAVLRQELNQQGQRAFDRKITELNTIFGATISAPQPGQIPVQSTTPTGPTFPFGLNDLQFIQGADNFGPLI